MTYSAIIDALNKLREEYENLVPFVEYLEDLREAQGLPPMTEQEREKAEQRVTGDAARAREIDGMVSDLLLEAEETYGTRPSLSEATGRYTF